MPLVFSYGTLQQEDVQLSTFGRLLQGHRDELVGFERSLVRTQDPHVVATSGGTHHANVIFNGKNDSRVSGTLFEITDAELAAADQYEQLAAYKRVVAALASGKQAWVYVHARSARKTKGYNVRPAAPEDIPFLPEIERIAGLLFKRYPGELGLTDEIYAHVTSVETFEKAQEAGHLWVAATPSGEIVGFALVLDIGGYAHLDELDVLPIHGRQGIGSALVATVCSWARGAAYPAVTLRTFRDVPWNGPFYHGRGFRVVDASALSPAHLDLEASERQRGLRTDLRVTMAYGTAG